MFVPNGYMTEQGYMGFLPDGRRILFTSDREYYEYLEEEETQVATQVA